MENRDLFSETRSSDTAAQAEVMHNNGAGYQAAQESNILAQKHCSACRGDVAPLSDQQVKQLLERLDQWSVSQDQHLVRTFPCKNFREALDLANRTGAIADAEGHHPDLLVSWGKLRVEIWTHKTDSLTENDFILAAKIDRLIS
jgi:4a-hydroxytetrahydrobiopterin dehydratase